MLTDAARHYASQHPDAADYDDPAVHLALLSGLLREYDGFVLATTTPGLRLYLPHTPADVRTGTWVKPAAGNHRQVRVSYAHEHVLFRTPRRGGIAHNRRADVLIAQTVVRNRGTVGAKPPAWTRWVLDLLGYRPGVDTVTDLFPGSGLVQEAIDGYRPGCLHCERFMPLDEFEFPPTLSTARPNAEWQHTAPVDVARGVKFTGSGPPSDQSAGLVGRVDRDLPSVRFRRETRSRTIHLTGAAGYIRIDRRKSRTGGTKL